MSLLRTNVRCLLSRLLPPQRPKGRSCSQTIHLTRSYHSPCLFQSVALVAAASPLSLPLSATATAEATEPQTLAAAASEEKQAGQKNQGDGKDDKQNKKEEEAKPSVPMCVPVAGHRMRWQEE